MTWRTLWDRAAALLECAVEELDLVANPDVEGAPPRVFVNPGGEVAFDDCCEHGGQLWVRVIRAHPVSPIPTKVTREVPCQDPVGVQLGLGIIRCVHVLGDDGDAPSADVLTADARQMVCDMASLLRAIECCDTDDEGTTLDQWLPIPAQGGCVGGEWTFWWTPRIACPDGGEST